MLSGVLAPGVFPGSPVTPLSPHQ